MRKNGGLILSGVLLAFSIAAHGSGKSEQAAGKPLALATQTTSFGPVVPGALGAPASVTLLFSLPISQPTAALGYRVTGISSFVFTPTIPAAGGKSVTAAGLLVGIVSVSSSLGASSNAAIATGFNYDPAAIRGAGGTSAVSGAATGRATLADLLSGSEVLRAAASTGKIPAIAGVLTVSMRIAVPTQFYTPGSFSGTISLIVSQ
jgi:hypothetical protein